MRNSLYSITLDEALERIGGHHRYQVRLGILIFAVLSTLYLIESFLVFSLLEPPLVCRDNNCCQMLEDSKQSIAADFELFCDRAPKTEVIMAALHVGYMLGAVLTYLTGRFGRKPVALVSGCFAGLSISLAALSASPEMLAGFSLFIGFFAAGAGTSLFLYIIEILDMEYRSIIVCVIFTAKGCGEILSAVLAHFSDWRLVFAFSGVLCLLTSACLFKFYETPRFLAAVQGKYSKARHTANHIAIINRRLGFPEPLEGEKVIGYQENGVSNREISHHQRKYSFIPISSDLVTVTYAELTSMNKYSLIDIFQIRSIRPLILNLCVLSAFLAISMAVVEGPKVYVERNTLLQVIYGISDMMSAVFSGVVVRFVERPTFLLSCTIVGEVLIVFILMLHSSGSLYDEENTMFFAFSCLFVIARAILVSKTLIVYLLSAENIPTNVRSYGVAFIQFFVRCGYFIGISVCYLSYKIGLSALIFVSVTLLVCLKSVSSLKDSDGLQMSDYLEEEKIDMSLPTDLADLNSNENRENLPFT